MTKSLAPGHDNTAGYTTLSGNLTPTSSGVKYPEWLAGLDESAIPHGYAGFTWSFGPLSDANYTLLLSYVGLTLNDPSIGSAPCTVQEVNRDRSTWVDYNATATHRPDEDGRFERGLWRGVRIIFSDLEAI